MSATNDNGKRVREEEWKNSFICPICMSFMAGHIYQCVLGHVVCASCLKNILRNTRRSCPSCRKLFRQDITKIPRNRSLEDLREKMFCPCPYDGCDEMVLHGDMASHKQHCVHKPNASGLWNGERYVGEWKHGKPHGKGTGVHLQKNNISMFFCNDSKEIRWKYSGLWKEGVPNSARDLNGARESYRAISDNEELIYEGEWLDGYPHGFGFAYNYTHTYEGYWKNGLLHGTNANMLTNGKYGDELPCYADATFVDDMITYGTVTNTHNLFPDIEYESYTGEFALKNCEGVPHGKGTMIFFNGDTYTGQFIYGSPAAIKKKYKHIAEFIDCNIIKNMPQTSVVGLNEIWLRYSAICYQDGYTANKEELRNAMELRFNEMTKQNEWAGWKGIALRKTS